MKQRFLLAMFVVLLMPLGTLADNLNVNDSFEANSIIYTVTSTNPLEVKVGKGESGNAVAKSFNGSLTIPSNVTGSDGKSYSVTSIGRWAFGDIAGLTAINLPNTIKNIEEMAFYDCAKLNSLTIPKSVTSIGQEIIAGCNALTTIKVESGNSVYDSRNSCNAIIETATNELIIGCKKSSIPSTVISIGERAFWYTPELTTISIPNSVTTIRNSAFGECAGLTSITIPASVTSIGTGIIGSNNLTTIKVANGNKVYDSRNSCNAIIETATNTLIAGCKKSTIPNSVTTIGYGAFGGLHDLKSINIPTSVTDIGEHSFSGSGLTSISIPNSVTHIGPSAFQGCENLASVTILNPSVVIGNQAFSYNESLSSITLPSSVTDIDVNAFLYSKWYNEQPVGPLYLCDILIGYKGSKYAEGWPAGAVVIKEGTKSIARGAFWWAGEATSVIMPNSVTRISESAFSYRDKITSITLSNSLTSIENSTFEKCKSLKEITIPNSVTTIGAAAFYGCESLESITMGNSVSFIGYNAFANCPKLDNLYISDMNTWCNINIYDMTSHPFYHSLTSKGTKHLFLSGTEVTDLVIPDGLTAIGNNAFFGCNSFTSVSIPSSVKTIGDYAFEFCTSLTSADLGTSVNVIGHESFSRCDLRSLNLPNSVTTIKGLAFEDCSMKSITIPESVTTIEYSVFSGCKNLTDVISLITTPSAIGDHAFGIYTSETGWTNDITLYVPVGTKTKYEATEGWKEFKNIVEMLEQDDVAYVIGEDGNLSVTQIKADEAGTVVIPASVEFDGRTLPVTELAADAIKDRQGVTSIELPASLTRIVSGNFRGCGNIGKIRSQSMIPIQFVPGAASKSRMMKAEDNDQTREFEDLDLDQCVLYVPFGSEELYRNAYGWSEFKHIVGEHSEQDPAATVTAKSYTREYGEENPAFEFTVEGAALDGQLVIECTATAASDAGEYDIVVSKGTVKNYNDTYVGGKLTITKAPLKVSVKDVEREQGTENPQFELTYEGWKLADTESVLAVKPMATTTATKDSPVGEYAITVSGGEAKNYELSYVDGKLTIVVPAGMGSILSAAQPADVYTPAGVLVKRQATTLKGLQKGVYIVGGKKLVIK